MSAHGQASYQAFVTPYRPYVPGVPVADWLMDPWSDEEEYGRPSATCWSGYAPSHSSVSRPFGDHQAQGCHSIERSY